MSPENKNSSNFDQPGAFSEEGISLPEKTLQEKSLKSIEDSFSANSTTGNNTNKSYIYESPTVNTLNQAIKDLEAKNGDYSNLGIIGSEDDQAAYTKYYYDVALGVRNALESFG